MNDLKKILDSFKQRKSLSPKIWVKKDGNVKLNSKVRTKLLEISYDFIEFIGIDIIISDIIVTGSLANYNWSNFSDVDLHILVNFDQFPKDQVELYKELFLLKKTLYNDKHDIMIYGYDVELYVQNEEEAHFSSGIYSILNDEWLNKPKKENVTVDTKLIATKSKQWMGMIDNVIENIEGESVEKAKQTLKKFKEKLKKYRTCGLEKEGEYSDENLVFKVLRRNGYIQKLFDFENKFLDKNYSLKEATTNIGGSFTTDVEYGPANHAKRALGNWQSDNAWDIFASPGSIVNSYTTGTVTKVKQSTKNSGKVYGTQVTVKGEGNFPDIFYTHIDDVNLTVGSKIKVGDYIGKVVKWQDSPSSSHVHIGLPYGRNLKELLVNSEIIFTGKENSESYTKQIFGDFELNSELNTVIVNKLQNLISDSGKYKGASKDVINDNLQEIVDGKNKTLQDLYNSIKNNKEFGKEFFSIFKSEKDKSLETIQKGLQFLNYLDSKNGISGKFDSETENAVKKFQKENNLTETGKLKKEDLIVLFGVLVIKNFKDFNVSGIEANSETNKIQVGDDIKFYEAILKGIGAPVTEENLKFFYAWRQSEGGKAKNNPFNTTKIMKKDIASSTYNYAKVKNYSTPEIGIEATVKTLLNGAYPCIVNGLRNDIGAEKISKDCLDNLKNWGTGGLIAKVISYGKINPPQIYT